jgi:hypothetical protein
LSYSNGIAGLGILVNDEQYVRTGVCTFGCPDADIKLPGRPGRRDHTGKDVELSYSNGIAGLGILVNDEQYVRTGVRAVVRRDANHNAVSCRTKRDDHRDAHVNLSCSDGISRVERLDTDKQHVRGELRAAGAPDTDNKFLSCGPKRNSHRDTHIKLSCPDGVSRVERLDSDG